MKRNYQQSPISILSNQTSSKSLFQTTQLSTLNRIQSTNALNDEFINHTPNIKSDWSSLVKVILQGQIQQQPKAKVKLSRQIVPKQNNISRSLHHSYRYPNYKIKTDQYQTQKSLSAHCDLFGPQPKKNYLLSIITIRKEKQKQNKINTLKKAAHYLLPRKNNLMSLNSLKSNKSSINQTQQKTKTNRESIKKISYFNFLYRKQYTDVQQIKPKLTQFFQPNKTNQRSESIIMMSPKQSLLDKKTEENSQNIKKFSLSMYTQQKQTLKRLLSNHSFKQSPIKINTRNSQIEQSTSNRDTFAQSQRIKTQESSIVKKSSFSKENYRLKKLIKQMI